MRKLSIVAVLATPLFLTGCFGDKSSSTDSSSAGNNSSIQQLNMNSSSNPAGCTVSQESGGVRITCGNSSGLVGNGPQGSAGAQGSSGSSGPSGAQGPQGPQGPPGGMASFLVNGNGTELGRVISFYSKEPAAERAQVTVWDSSTNSTASYWDGEMQTPWAFFYKTSDCTGAAYRSIDEDPDGSGNPAVNTVKDRLLAFKGQIYKVGIQYESSMLSRIEGTGPCAQLGYGGKFQNADLVQSSLPIKLSPGWAVKVH